MKLIGLEKNIISPPLSKFLILGWVMLLVSGCKTHEEFRKEILNAKIVSIEFSDLTRKMREQVLPTVDFTVRLVNASKEPYKIYLDSIASGPEYRNFLLVIKKNDIPYLVNLKYAGCNKSYDTSQVDLGAVRLSINEVILMEKDSVDVHFHYDRDDLLSSLKAYNGDLKGKKSAEIYLDYVKRLIGQNPFLISLWLDSPVIIGNNCDLNTVNAMKLSLSKQLGR